MKYHRCDGKRRSRYYTRPGKYGLYCVLPGHAASVGREYPVTTANTVAALLMYRRYLKPYLLCFVAAYGKPLPLTVPLSVEDALFANAVLHSGDLSKLKGQVVRVQLPLSR